MLQRNAANLLYLVRFRVSTVTLKTDFLRNALLPIHVMAPAYALFESLTTNQGGEIEEADIGIRSSAQA